MSDAFSKIVAILLCVVMMYIIPVFYMQEETNRFRQTYVLETVTSFTDGVRNTGILGKSDYDRLKEELSGLGAVYTLELTHCTYTMEDDAGEVYYFAEEYYNPQILEYFERGEDYLLNENDYLKVVVRDSDGNIVAWYGGSVRYEAY